MGGREEGRWKEGREGERGETGRVRYREEGGKAEWEGRGARRRKGGGLTMMRGTELHKGGYKCFSKHVFSRRCHVSYRNCPV